MSQIKKKMKKKDINTWWIPIFICNFNKSIETAKDCISIFHKMIAKIYLLNISEFYNCNNYGRQKKW
ncbi:MAG: hypothetical protein RLZZ628_2764 [Bacteroidota bacterium]|jgi:hypothetical protein